MIFGKLVDGQVVEAPQEYTSDKGKYINDFPRYLEVMHKNRFLDRMYGYTDIEELTKITNEEKIKNLEEDNLFLTASNFDLDFRLFEIEELIANTSPNTLNLKNINNELGGENMTQYLMAKKLILAGYYDKADMEYKLGRYLTAGKITQAQYDELMALMAADDIIK